VEKRTWDDYSIGKATVPEHLAALDLAYGGLISDHRSAQETAARLDPVTEDLLLGQLGQLEQFQWFVRAHLENAAGELVTTAPTEREAAQQADDVYV
jgi:starvation-inducible DNA-binding protein